MKNNSPVLWLLLTAGLLSACVTINVYFPAAAAEKAADRIIEEVWGEDAQSGQTDELEPQASITKSYWLLGLVDWLIPVAYAQADLDISTPAIQKLRSSMQARHGELESYYDAGAAGLTSDGLISVRDAKAVELKKRNELKKLVAAENKDRNDLYREIAIANGHPEWEAEIRSTFAGRWISKAKAGWWYDSGTGWRQR